MDSIFVKNASGFESDGGDEETEIDYKQHLKDLSISKEIIRGSKLRDQKLKSAPLRGSYDEFNIEFTMPKCSSNNHRTKYKKKKSTKRAQHSRSSTRSAPFPNFSVDFGRKSTTPTIVIPDSSQKQKHEKLGCPMRIVELAVPSKRLCIDTWREKKGVLPAYMVERLKKLVLDQKPVVEINDALKCFRRKTLAGKRQGNKITPKSKTSKDMRYTLMMCAAIANKLIKDYSVPYTINISEEHAKISHIVRKEIKSIMRVHKTKLSKNKEREILTDVANRLAIWIAIVQEHASYKILEEELRELEEEEGPVLDILDDIFDHSMDICISKYPTPPPDPESDDGDFKSLSEHSETAEENKEDPTQHENEQTEKESVHDEDQDNVESNLHETSEFVHKEDLPVPDFVSETQADPQDSVSQNDTTSGAKVERTALADVEKTSVLEVERTSGADVEIIPGADAKLTLGAEVEPKTEAEMETNYNDTPQEERLDDIAQDQNEQTPEDINQEKGGVKNITAIIDEPLLNNNDLPDNNYEDITKTGNIAQDEDTPVSNMTIDSPNEPLKSEIESENGKEQDLDKESFPIASLEKMPETNSVPNQNLGSKLNDNSNNSNRLKRKRENNEERIKFSIPNEYRLSNINIGPMNENLLSSADESWPDDIETSSLKLTDVVSRSVTSLGKIHETDIDDDNLSEETEEIVGGSIDITANSDLINRKIIDEFHPEDIIKEVIQYGEDHDTKHPESNDIVDNEIKVVDEIPNGSDVITDTKNSDSDGIEDTKLKNVDEILNGSDVIDDLKHPESNDIEATEVQDVDVITNESDVLDDTVHPESNDTADTKIKNVDEIPDGNDVIDDTKLPENDGIADTEIKVADHIPNGRDVSDPIENTIEEHTGPGEDSVNISEVIVTNNEHKSSKTKQVTKRNIIPVTDVINPIINEILNEIVKNKRNSKDIQKKATKTTDKTTKSPTINKNMRKESNLSVTQKPVLTKGARTSNASGQSFKNSKKSINKIPKTVHNVKYKPKNISKAKVKTQKEDTFMDSDPLVTEINEPVSNEIVKKVICGCKETNPEMFALDSLDQEKQFDYRVDINKAPTWVKKVFDEDYQAKELPISKQSEVRKWCKDIETLAGNMEKWIEWRDAITENIIDMKRNEIRSYYSASKRTSETDYKQLEEWINLNNDVESDVTLWTRLFQRTLNKLEKRVKTSCC